MIRFLLGKEPVLMSLCRESLLPTGMKEAFAALIGERCRTLWGE